MRTCRCHCRWGRLRRCHRRNRRAHPCAAFSFKQERPWRPHRHGHLPPAGRAALQRQRLPGPTPGSGGSASPSAGPSRGQSPRAATTALRRPFPAVPPGPQCLGPVLPSAAAPSCEQRLAPAPTTLGPSRPPATRGRRRWARLRPRCGMETAARQPRGYLHGQTWKNRPMCRRPDCTATHWTAPSRCRAAPAAAPLARLQWLGSSWAPRQGLASVQALSAGG